MHQHVARSIPLVVGILSSAACAAYPEADDEASSATSALVADNAMNLNAMNLNALRLDTLALRALHAGALDPGALSALQAPSPTGDLARQLVRYAASCALEVTQSFAFTWTDGAGQLHAETYPGLLGLSPSWATGPIGRLKQQWVSACLISRVNYFGVPVTISSRGANAALRTPDAAELAAFSAREGAFWGNLFDPTPTAFACDHPPDDQTSRRLLRVCAAGYLDPQGTLQSCGIIQRVGACDTHCLSLAGGYYLACSADGSSYHAQVITTYLAP